MEKTQYSAADLEQLVLQFQARSLAAAAWTHEAHLIVALTYLRQYSKTEATCYLRTGIISYHSSQGGLHSKTSGYHETLTLFWIWAVDRFLQIPDVAKLNQEAQVAALFDSPWSDKNLALQYYSKDYLMSLEARTYWKEPDLKSIADIFG
jgi:hypothetical protein